MRSLLALLALAACGGGAALSDAPPGDVGPALAGDGAPSDADTSVTGTWIDTYYATTGTSISSACGSAPLALVVDENTGLYASYTGACQPTGAFRIATPALASYYARAGGNLVATTAHSGLQLGRDHLGRPDVAGITGVELDLELTGMEPWGLGDVMMAWSANVGWSQALVFDSGAPGVDATALSATAAWSGYALDAAKSDALEILQLGSHTSAGGLGFVTLDRAYDAAPFTMTAGTPARVPATGTDTFATPTAGALHFSIDAAAWDALAAGATPATTTHTLSATLYASTTPEVAPSPPLFDFAHDSGALATAGFDVSYGDPFPPAWTRRMHVAEAFATSYTYDFATGGLSAVMAETVPVGAAEASTVTPLLGPPTNVTLDGQDAQAATYIAAAPLVAWSAPALGTPTDYEVTIYQANVSGQLLGFQQVARVLTKATSVRIPDGFLVGGRQYVFRVTAHLRLGIDIAVTPEKLGGRTFSADVLSALVTTSS